MASTDHFGEDQVRIDLRKAVIHDLAILAELHEALAVQVRLVGTIGPEGVLTSPLSMPRSLLEGFGGHEMSSSTVPSLPLNCCAIFFSLKLPTRPAPRLSQSMLSEVIKAGKLMIVSKSLGELGTPGLLGVADHVLSCTASLT